MKIIATKYRREDGVHIVLINSGWLVLCQKGPMRVWIKCRWDILFKYEKFDEFTYSKEMAMSILKTVKHPNQFNDLHIT